MRTSILPGRRCFPIRESDGNRPNKTKGCVCVCVCVCVCSVCGVGCKWCCNTTPTHPHPHTHTCACRHTRSNITATEFAKLARTSPPHTSPFTLYVTNFEQIPHKSHRPFSFTLSPASLPVSPFLSLSSPPLPLSPFLSLSLAFPARLTSFSDPSAE